MDQLYSTVSTSNFTSSPGLLPHSNWYTKRLLPSVVFALCLLLGVPGNIAVIILRPNWQHLSSLSHSLMLNLAVSDLICLLTLPIWIYAFFNSWTFGLVFCKLLSYVVYCTIYCSLLTVTGLSIQRYLVVVHQQRCNQVRIRLLLVLLWLVAFILSIPTLVVRQLVRDQQWTDCQAQFSSDAQGVASLLTETMVVFICFSVVVFSYICLYKKVHQATHFSNPRTTQLVTNIVLSFFVLWVPYHTVGLLGVAAICLKNESLLKFHKDTWRIFAAVTFINSGLNPLLYAFASFNFCSNCQKHEPQQQNQRNPQTPDVATVAELT